MAGNVSAQADEEYVAAALGQLQTSVDGGLRLPIPLPEPAVLMGSLLDQLISIDTTELNAVEPLAWSPLPADRSRKASSLGEFLELPWGGPQRVVLAGFATAAENGLKGSSRRIRAVNNQPGSELFFSSCALASAGVRTALVSRWRTGGQTNLALVNEFAQELPHTSAAAAWQRSVLLARAAPLDPDREPRLKVSGDEAGPPATADHPFLWAGYLLLDTVGEPLQAGAAGE